MLQRIQKWDILKFFLMFTVVLGHFFEYHTDEYQMAKGMFLFIYFFHMPLFVFVSGLFSKRTVNEKRWDKILGYLVLTFVTKLLMFTFNGVLTKNLYFNTFGDSGLPWFLFAIFVFFAITVFTKNYKPQYVLAISILLALVVGYDNQVNYKFALSRIIVFYPFFFLGYITDVKKLEEFCKGKVKKVLSFLVVTAFLIACLSVKMMHMFRPLVTGQNSYQSLGELSELGFLCRLSYYVVAIVVGLAIIILTPENLGKGAIAKKGQFTLPVYMLHYVVMIISYRVFDVSVYIDKWWKMFIFFPASFVITYILSNEKLNKLINKLYEIPKQAKIK